MTRPSGTETRTWLHPWTGVTILGLDWLLFGSNLLSGMTLTPLFVVLGALSGFVAAFFVERRRAGRPVGRSLLAGLLAAAVVGAPLPLAGTLVGAWVIALSGLPSRGR